MSHSHPFMPQKRPIPSGRVRPSSSLPGSGYWIRWERSGSLLTRRAALLHFHRVPRSTGGIGLRGLRSEEHTSELQSRLHLVCRLLLEKKKNNINVLVNQPPARSSALGSKQIDNARVGKHNTPMYLMNQVWAHKSCNIGAANVSGKAKH